MSEGNNLMLAFVYIMPHLCSVSYFFCDIFCFNLQVLDLSHCCIEDGKFYLIKAIRGLCFLSCAFFDERRGKFESKKGKEVGSFLYLRFRKKKLEEESFLQFGSVKNRCKGGREIMIKKKKDSSNCGCLGNKIQIQLLCYE